MSHPRELIELVAAKLRADYSPDVFDYVIEKSIPGTRMFPDVAIYGRDGAPVCVVEIGYTRPEKLERYRRQLRIPDVRWYDKAGNLCASALQHNVPVSVSVDVTPEGRFWEYRIVGWVMCANGCPDPSDESSAVITLIVTNYVRAFLLCECELCGQGWLADTDEMGGIRDTLQGSPREIAEEIGARTKTSWGAVVADADALGVDLAYHDGWLIAAGGSGHDLRDDVGEKVCASIKRRRDEE